MFGYVTIYKDELKIKEYNVFRGYYCGLCKMLKKRFNNLVRLGLSYDMTFLALVLSSVLGEDVEFAKQRCMLHPVSKRFVAKSSEAVLYSANVSILLVMKKLKDDWKDERNLKAAFAMLAYILPYKKAKKSAPREEQLICNALRELSVLECQNESMIDKVADCFAGMLGGLFSPQFIQSKKEKEALFWLGYNLGRWIYILDAYQDISKDCKKKSYNPFLAEFKGKPIEEYKNQLSQRLEISMTFCLENMSKSMDLLQPKNKELIENIIYLGLRKKQEIILNKQNNS